MSIAYLANLLSNTVNAQVPVHVYVERDADKETLVKDLAAHMGVTAINLESALSKPDYEPLPLSGQGFLYLIDPMLRRPAAVTAYCALAYRRRYGNYVLPPGFRLLMLSDEATKVGLPPSLKNHSASFVLATASTGRRN